MYICKLQGVIRENLKPEVKPFTYEAAPRVNAHTPAIERIALEIDAEANIV